MATKHPSSRRYPPEVKHRAVQLVLSTIEHQGERHGVVSRIARQLDIGREGITIALAGGEDFRMRWKIRNLTATEVGHVYDWMASQIQSAIVRPSPTGGRGRQSFRPDRVTISWR
jgi:hypothetical protein